MYNFSFEPPGLFSPLPLHFCHVLPQSTALSTCLLLWLISILSFVLQFLNQSMSPEHSDSESLPMSSPVDSKPLIDHTVRSQKENEMWVAVLFLMSFNMQNCFKACFTNIFLFLRFRTPNIRRSILESSPCTPTPFRSTMALQESKYGPLKLMVSA